MRNETLKNLLLTASLISASALLTACGDPASDSSPASQAEGKVKAALETAKTEEAQAEEAKRKAAQAIDESQKELAVHADAGAAQLNEMLTAFDVSVPTIPTVSRDAMNKAKLALLNYDKDTLASIKKSVDDLNRSFDLGELSKSAPVNYADSVAVAAKLTEALSKMPTSRKKVIDDLNAKLVDYIFGRNALEDTYYNEFLKYQITATTPSTANDAATPAKLEKLREDFAQKSAQVIASLTEMIDNVDRKRALYLNVRTNISAHLEEINATIAQNSDFLSVFDHSALEIKRGLSGTFGTAAGFDDAYKAYFAEIKPKLLACSLTADDLALDIVTKFSKFITVSQSIARAPATTHTLDEWMSGRFTDQAGGQRIQTLVKNRCIDLIRASNLQYFIKDPATAAAAEEYLAAALSSGSIKDLSGNVSLRTARTAVTGLVDGSAFKVNGVAGQSVDLGMPLFVQLKGDVSSAKATDAATGSVAYRLGNTVIGAIQGYANSGAGFGIDSRQLETSVVASHSFGSFFVEGQIGSVSATEVHNSNWSGLRSQVTLGLDTEFVSPFVQVAHRQLDRSGLNLNETTAYVGLDAEVAKLAADTYSIDTRLLAKAGYGSKNWSANSKDLGSTTGFSGSVEWSSSLNLNSGVSFSSNLALDTVAGSSAALNVSLDR
ncbi:hypothetical protein [Candidatus Bodocaedibacter vickermanii]|uniref:Uncharacterized protein n=1 Tax=Candidatus Bodocaedibacter vickermanii TaxID=2741701 RepID=A0A7L9RUU4_9PROT|nr:hypothetical protein CPBP_01112 [Candidatus Paracaedibacteraceae bacterium 'Lake Konstanz']